MKWNSFERRKNPIQKLTKFQLFSGTAHIFYTTLNSQLSSIKKTSGILVQTANNFKENLPFSSKTKLIPIVLYKSVITI
jgi:hypothetical protein